MKTFVVTLQTLKRVLFCPRYLLIALIISIFVFVAAILFSNIPLLINIIGDADISLGTKINIIFNLLGGISTNFSLFSAAYTILTAILVGINLSLLIFYFKNKQGRLSGKVFGSASGGLFSGVLGIGCAACGSLILSLFFPFLGAGVLLSILPLKGGEFGLLALLLLSLSIVLISKQISRPNICQIEIK